MILQLLSITLLLLSCYLPICILMMINSIIIPTDLEYLIQLYLYFFGYLVVLLMPFVCLPSIISMCVKTVVFDLTVEISISRVLTNNKGQNRK